MHAAAGEVSFFLFIYVLTSRYRYCTQCHVMRILLTIDLTTPLLYLTIQK